MTTEERKKLRDEKVFALLAKQPKVLKKRKPGVRPPNAKGLAIPASEVPEPEKAEKPSGVK